MHTEVAVSDIAGCVLIQQPRIATPDLGPAGLLNPLAPEVLVMEGLRAVGWTFRQRSVPHVREGAGSEKITASGKWQKRNTLYFQCCLFLHELWGRGLASLGYAETQAYYRAILASSAPGQIPTG